MQYSIFILLQVLSASICFFSMLYVIRHLRIVTSRSMALIMFLMMLWAMSGAAEMLFTDLSLKLIAIQIGYIAFALMIPSWFMFMLSYMTRKPQGKNPVIIGLFALFSVFVFLNWFNPDNGFYISKGLTESKGLIVFHADYGYIFWIYTACNYLTLAAMLASMFIATGTGRLRLRHSLTMLGAVLVPLIFNVLYLFKLIPYDLTSVGFIITCVLFSLLYRDEFFARLPLSHKSVIDAMSSGYILLDSHLRIIEMNKSAVKMLYLTDETDNAQVEKLILEKWRIDPTSSESASTLQEFADPSTAMHYYRISVNKMTLRKKNVCDYALFLQDETALYNVRERIRYLERYDESTKLYNHRYFLELLDAEIERSKSGRGHYVVLGCAQVLNYRDCCYMYGNDFGNSLIHTISTAIKDIMRGDDVISRFSIDEIYLFMRFDNSANLTERVETTLNRIFKYFQKPIEVNGESIEVKMHIGVAYAPQHADNSNNLIRMANMARRSVSKYLKNPYSIYHERTGEGYYRSQKIENDLHTAIENGQLHLMYQPQVDINTGKTVGVEALVRWNHPELGAVVPADFIPIAEENGLINQIGLWVIKQAVLQLKLWQDMGFSTLKMGANVSLSQLTNESFADDIIALVQETAVNAHNLELEITESLALFPEAMIHGHLPKLRKNKIRIAMDDFGMGHSSLAYIKQFELDTIKIDRTLSQDILTNPTSIAMIRSVRMLCESLRIDTVVECIEHPEQLQILKDLRCTIVQGYVYSPPLSPDVCTAYLQNTGVQD